MDAVHPQQNPAFGYSWIKRGHVVWRLNRGQFGERDLEKWGFTTPGDLRIGFSSLG